MKRPKPPVKFDSTPEACSEHNRYFNEAEILFSELEQKLPKLAGMAAPYTGEYAGGQMDLICDILGIERIDWSTDFDSLHRTKTGDKNDS